MATVIHALHDTIKIDKAFVSGKDRVAVNGEVVFQGKLRPGTPQEINVGHRRYTLKTQTVNSLTSAVAIHLQIHEEDQQLYSAIHDPAGKPAESEYQVQRAGAIQAWAAVGGMIGGATMMILNVVTGVVPGGAIGGMIGGGVGAAIGYGIGSMLFGDGVRRCPYCRNPLPPEGDGCSQCGATWG